MATIKQRKAVEKLVENGGNVSKAMKDAGYSKETAKTPQKLTDSAGFRELMETVGLTDTMLLKALVADIKAKPSDRKQELELGFKLRGRMREQVEHSGKDGAPIIFDIMGNPTVADADSTRT